MKLNELYLTMHIAKTMQDIYYFIQFEQFYHVRISAKYIFLPIYFGKISIRRNI